MIKQMRRLLHSVLGAWFLVVMTMAQGCVGPAQSAGSLGSRAAGGASGSASQFDRAQKMNQEGGTAGYVADPAASTALSGYLKRHRLPLVGAQVMRNPTTGARTVVLYGFVGSDFGKSDAQRKAEDYVNDPTVEVDNRIRVNPELLAAGRSTAGGNPSVADDSADAQAQAGASMPGVQSYADQQNQSAQIQQYQQQNSVGSMSSMLPLIALLGMLSMAGGSGGFSTGPSFGYSPFGSSPFGSSPYGTSPYGYSPYSPYSPYLSPMPPNYGPGYGYGSSGGVTPFGTLPGSPYRSFP